MFWGSDLGKMIFPGGCWVAVPVTFRFVLGEGLFELLTIPDEESFLSFFRYSSRDREKRLSARSALFTLYHALSQR